jgi:hypothetical protein
MNTYSYTNHGDFRELVQSGWSQASSSLCASLLSRFMFVHNPSVLSVVIRSSNLALMLPNPVCVHPLKLLSLLNNDLANPRQPASPDHHHENGCHQLLYDSFHGSPLIWMLTCSDTS